MPVRRRTNGRFAKRGPRRTFGANILAQGVGSVPRIAFGGRDSSSLSVWDAKLPHHLPLPRAVGPYTTIRVTKRFTSTSKHLVFGTFQSAIAGYTAPTGYTNVGGDWSPVCCVESAPGGGGLPINGSGLSGLGNARLFNNPITQLGEAATLCPSALTVQIICPKSLTEAEGIIYGGVMNTQAPIGGDLRTWNDYFDNFVAYQAPRMMSAGKVVLRGVQANSLPLDMSKVSDFTMLKERNHPEDTDFAWNGFSVQPAGWAPILVYNTGSSSASTEGVALEYLVTTEYRVRFDLAHPASASHTLHRVTSDATWGNLMERAVAMGNGVRDIADVVSNAGMAAGRAVAVSGALARAIPMITPALAGAL